MSLRTLVALMNTLMILICDDFTVVGVSGMDSETFVVVLLVVVQSFYINRSPQ